MLSNKAPKKMHVAIENKIKGNVLGLTYIARVPINTKKRLLLESLSAVKYVTQNPNTATDNTNDAKKSGLYSLPIPTNQENEEVINTANGRNLNELSLLRMSEYETRTSSENTTINCKFGENKLSQAEGSSKLTCGLVKR